MTCLFSFEIWSREVAETSMLEAAMKKTKIERTEDTEVDSDGEVIEWTSDKQIVRSLVQCPVCFEIPFGEILLW